MKKIYTFYKTGIKSGLFALLMFFALQNANAQCAITFTPTYNTNGNVSFNSTATPTGMVSYYWSYYNGMSYVNAGQNPNYTYSSNGTYTVTLFAIFGPSVAPTCSNVANAVVTITNALCPAGFNAAFAYTIGAANSVSFASTSTGTTGSTTFLYKFGDGNTANTANTTHTYPSSSSYQAKLILIDGACADSAMVTVTPCGFNPSFTSTLGASGLVNVTSTSTGTAAATYHKWSWGDGSPLTQGAGLTATSHNYAINNSYVILLTLANSSVAPTCTASASQTVTVTSACSQSLNAAFTSTLVGSSGQVNFVSTSTGTVATTIHSWNFGDGASGTGPTVSHTYANGGVHNVKLSLFDSVGPCYDSIVQSVNVTNVPCSPNSNFTLTFSGTPQLWYANPAYYGNIQSAQWSWGDGQFSNNLFTSHTYSTAGMYNICLTVTTSCGTSSTCVNQNIFKSMTSDPNQAMVTINVVPGMVTGIAANAEENASVSLFPNPNNGTFNLNIENVYSESVNISIYNILGEKVYSTTGKTTNGNLRSDINTGSLSNGTYYIQVKSDTKSYNLKTVINK